MKAHPNDLKMSAELNPEAFMDGVALFDEMLREADRVCRSKDSYGVYIEAECRVDHEQSESSLPAPLNLYLLPLLRRLQAEPHLLPGFAVVLGDYLGWLHSGMTHGNGPQYECLQFDEVWLDQSEQALAPSNVVQFAPRPVRARNV